MQNEAKFSSIASLRFKILTKLCAKRGYKKIIEIFPNSLLFALESCGVGKINPRAQAIDDVYIFQNGKSQTIKSTVGELKLKRGPFSIQFFNKVSNREENDFFVTRIAAVPNQEELDKIRVGQDAEKTGNLGSPDALAISTKTGYNKELFVNDYGHHMLYYENTENRTVDVIGKKGAYVLFQFEVASIFKKPDFIPIGETAIETLFFAIYSDYNQNKIIDTGELRKITIQLE